MRRVVITGIGLLTPLGWGRELSWSRILAGQSGANRITAFDPTDYACQVACEVPRVDGRGGGGPDVEGCFDPDQTMAPKDQRRVDDFILYAIAAADEAVRAVLLLSANPKVFCAGLDLDLVKGGKAADMRRFLDRLYVELAQIQYGLGKPVIAAVEGAARAGGMTLAVSCDMLIAGERASFGYPEIDVGIIPAIHFVLLPRIVGKHRAFELLFGGRPFDARRAETLGLVNRVVPDDKLQAEAFALAKSMAEGPTLALRYIKDNLDEALQFDFATARDHEAERLTRLTTTADHKEAVQAFIEKRKAVFGTS